MDTERSRDDRLDEPPAGDDRLARLLSEYVNRLNSGEALDAARIREEHPDVAGELIAELETFEAFGAGFDSQPAIGTLGDYTLRHQIGRGGMGVVYEAWENSMNRPVALKVLPAGVAADSRTLTRFVREAQVAGSLRHANIVSVYGMGLKEKTPYFAMELVDGETLAQILARMKQQNGDERTAFGFARDDVAYYSTLARCFADVADGLQHAHSRGVIHRDIKPSNLILDRGRDGGRDDPCRLRILDFGLAHLEGQESITLSGDFVGTPAYMSPEQARARRIPIDHRTDVYSLGATLYEMLTRVAPFRGKDHAETLSQIIERDPVAPRGINARVPKDLETIVLKCLRKNAGDRYGTAEALAQDLRRFVRGDPIEARPQARWERLLRKAVRRRTPLAASLLVLTLAAAVTWLALVQARELERQREAAYEPKLRRAVELLQLTSLGRQAEAWEPLLIDPRRAVFARGHEGEAGGSEILAGLDSAEEAVREFREAVKMVPGRPDAHYYLAKGLLILGKVDEASRAIERALAADSGFVPARFLEAAILERQGDQQGSRALLAEAERIARGGWGEDWLLARRLFRQGRWREAADAATKSLRREAGDPEPYAGMLVECLVLRGAARIENGERVGLFEALSDLGAARFLWPGASQPVLLEAKAYYLLGAKEESDRHLIDLHAAARFKDDVALGAVAMYAGAAIRDEAMALEWAERLPPGWLREWNRAESLVGLGRDAEAVEAGRAALSFAPRNADVRATLALARYLRLGRFQDAIEILEEGLELDPSSALLHYHLGCVLSRSGEPEKAAASFREAARLSPEDARMRADLGLSLAQAGETREGIVAIEEAIALDPGLAYAHNNLGLVLFWAGRLDDSLEALEEAIRLDPAWSWPHLNRARVLERQGKHDDAIRAYTMACERIPRSSEAYRELAGLLHRQGKLVKAREVCEEGLEAFSGDSDLTRELDALGTTQ